MKFFIKFITIITMILSQQFIIAEIPAQVEAFKKAVLNPNQVANCAGCDFRGTQDLAGIDAHGANLPGIILQPCVPNDTNANVGMVCIPDQVANLAGINLANATLFSSCLDGAVLDKADLSNADLSNSSVRYVSLMNAKVAGVITTNSSFCNSIMPDGQTCTDTWSGQGVTIACNCAPVDAQISASKKSKSSKK